MFKHFPLSFHKQAKDAAKASIAAYEQGKFWQYHDLLYENYKTLTKASYEQFAGQLGLDIKTFNRTRHSPQTNGRIQQDMAMARKAQVSGTPAIFVTGHRVNSKDRNMKFIQALIDQELAAKK